MTRANALLRPALLVYVAVWCAAYLTTPFGWDQGIFAWVGDTILRGGLPYRDAWEMKGPLAYLPFAAAQAVFGRTLWGIRLLDLVLLAAAAFVLRAILRHLGRPAAADLAAIGFVLWYASGSFWHTAQPDGWIAMISAIGFAPLFTRGESPVRAVAAAGLVVGLGLLVKPLYGLLAAVPAAYLLTAVEDRRGRALLAGSAAAAIPLLVAGGWFWWGGAWSDLTEVYLRYPLVVYSGLADEPLASRLEAGFDYVFRRGIILLVLPAAAVGWWRLWSEHRPAAATLMTWVAIVGAIVIAQGRFFTYHWLPVLPPLTVLAAVGFHAVLAGTRSPAAAAGRTFAGVALAVLGVRLIAGPTLDMAYFAAYATGLQSEAAYYDHFGIAGSERRAARYIEERTAAGDPVLVWGWNVGINYMSGRPSPSRFGFSLPLMMGPGSAFRAAYREEFMAALEARPPAFVVEAPQAERLLEGTYDMRDFPELHAYVLESYELDHRFGELVLFRRQGAAGAGVSRP